jgi:putative membrane protein
MLQLLPLALGTVLYALRVRTLRRRGTPLPTWRPALFGVGAVLVAVALLPPIERWAEDLFTFHMVQHLLLGDLGPLCIVAGLSGPALRPLLSVRTVQRLRVLAHPLVALPLWAANLLVWHLPFLYEAALRHDSVHALEHVAFFTAGALMWAPVLEVLPGPEWFGTAWKMGYMVVVRAVSTVLGNVFVWAGHPFYSVYERDDPRWGVSADADQGIAGAVMMVEGSLVTIGALAWLFLRLAAEGELRQELIERGLDPRAVRRAVRYGRAEDMAEPPTSGVRPLDNARLKGSDPDPRQAGVTQTDE